jgi:hypothetical protein
VDNFIKSTTTFEEVDAIVQGAIIGAGRGTAKDDNPNSRASLFYTGWGREEEERVRRAREERPGETVEETYRIVRAGPSKVGRADEAIKDVLARTMGPQAKASLSEMQDKFRAKRAQKRANGRT